MFDKNYFRIIGCTYLKAECFSFSLNAYDFHPTFYYYSPLSYYPNYYPIYCYPIYCYPIYCYPNYYPN
jgi:hypothetical protein